MGGALGLAVLTSLAAQYTSHLIDSDYRRRSLALDERLSPRLLLGAPLRRSRAVVAFRYIATDAGNARGRAAPCRTACTCSAGG